MTTFNLLDIALIAGLVQGVFLALALQMLHNRNKKANRILSTLLSFCAIMLFGRLSHMRFDASWVGKLGLLIDTIIFLFGPLMYVYVRRLIFLENPTFQLSRSHYIPAATHLVYAIGYFSIDVAKMRELHANGMIYYFYFGVELLGLISLCFYLIKSWKLFFIRSKMELEQLSNPQVVRSFLKVFLGSISFCFFFWLFSFLNTFFIQLDVPLANYSALWISIPIFIYGVGYYSLKQPEIFRVPILKAKAEKNRLSPEEIKQLQKRLHFFIHEERAYLDSDITLKSLSDKINTSTNNLSWLLNQVYQQKFYDYINSHRIAAFVKKIENQEHDTHTLLALAMDVGFNSKSTFNKVFKEQKGVTPSAYIKQKSVA